MYTAPGLDRGRARGLGRLVLSVHPNSGVRSLPAWVHNVRNAGKQPAGTWKDGPMAIQERLTLRNLYLYLVCLITLVISIFAAVLVVRNTVELLYPDPGYYGYAPPRESGISADEQRRVEQAARDSRRRDSVLGLVGSGTTLLIAVPLYLYHWRRVQSELPGQPAQPPAGVPAA